MTRSFGLVGAGRAGRSVAMALSDVGWEWARTYRRGDDVSDASTGVDLCIIATPDAAISEVAAAIRPGSAVVMHLSGATPLTTIRHERPAALHPLVSLADPERGRHQLRSAWFAVAGDPLATEVATELSDRFFTIADADRTLYHAAAVVASNHLVAVLGQAERIGVAIGVPIEALLALAGASLDNVIAMGPAAALTGPASRGDDEVIEMHIAALRDRLPEEVPAYESMVAESRRLSGRDIRAD